MSCPTDLELIADLDGEATTNRARVIETHVEGCAACRDKRGRLVRARTALKCVVAPSDAAFVGEVMKQLPAPSKRRVPAVGLGIAAALLLALIVWPRGSEDPMPRGGAIEAGRALGVELIAIDGAVLEPAAEIKSGTPLGARIFNRTGKAVFLALFLVDSHGEIFWIEPAYLDPASDPRSIRVTAQVVETADVVAFDDLAPGPLHVTGLFTEAPVSVKRIEALLQNKAGLSELNPLAMWEQRLEVAP